MRNSHFVFHANTRLLIKTFGPMVLIALFMIFKPEAHAVPSYSRQTGLPCASCHYAPPELNAFGRKFKLDGYVFKTKPELTDDKKDHNAALQLLEAFPLSVLFDTSLTSTKAPQPGTQNGNFLFPQDASLFLAGAWSNHVGSFVQVTYDSQADHFTWDNTDIRYANNHELFGKVLAYGITLNNNPTVEDLWNSTPAWGFPFTSSNVAPGPSAGALINGGLAQDVAGVGGYAMWNEHLYIAGTLYRSEHIGAAQPLTGTGSPINIRGTAPYWRVAWQTVSKNNSLEVGAYGIHVRSTPNAVVGPTDSYTDWAADFQYDRTIPQWKSDVLSFRGTYIRENSSLLATFGAGGATFPRHHLNTVQGNVEYHFGTKVSAAAGLFHIDGTPDALLFPQAAVSGSANGDPRSSGYILNLSWWPVQNIGLTAQYTGYSRFNGLQTNYDGAGRNASGNNSIYLLARFIF
ncbi:MAG TPA: hypothetical protein VNY81_09260 [Candidatus Saccharimonadales bacterium]|nr:hypothetical protein [Candidatus Saccharimonadales bacterium]